MTARNLEHAVLLVPLASQLRGEVVSHDLAESHLLADLLELCREDPLFGEMARALMATMPGESLPSPRFTSLWLTIVERLSSAGHHHLGLAYLRWGWVSLSRGPRARHITRDHFARSIRHFARVLADVGYWRELAEAVGSSREDGDALRRRLPARLLEPHRDALLTALMPEQPFAHHQVEAHWRVLVVAPDLLGPHDEVRPLLETAAGRCRAAVLDAVLGHAETLADGVSPAQSPLTEIREPFYYLNRFVGVAGMDEELSIWVVEQATRWAWVLYKTAEEERLRALLHATRAFGNHLEGLLRRGDGGFGRQSLMGDYLLFVADFADHEGEEQLIERALTVCPQHRNARMMMAHVHLRYARLALQRAQKLTFGLQDGRREALREARERVEQARRCHPENEKIAAVEAEVEETAARLGEGG